MAKYTLEHKSKIYGMKEGWVYKDNYNEKLDNAVAILQTIENIDIAPFDFVKILKDDEPFKTLIVDNYVREIVRFSPQRKYKYTINLMSVVKFLERITLPSLSITKPINGERRSVFYYIKLYVLTYAPLRKVKYQNDNFWSYAPIFSLGIELDRFKKIPCPDFSWNNPTLKEVLDDLMMVDDCICVVNDKTISYLPLDRRRDIIDESKLYNETESMTATDYMTDLDITMKNAIGENKVTTCEYISTRSEGGELTTENMNIITNNPIYNIKSIKACFVLKYINYDTTVTKYAYVEAEIAPLIKEQEEFNILSGIKDVNAYTFAEASKYQKYCLYYKRGDNKIQNLGDSRWFGDTTTTLSRVIDVACREDKDIKNLYADKPSGELRIQKPICDIRDVAFKIEYETLADHKMRVGKYLPSDAIPNSIFDAQSESYVDIKNQANFEYSKINRFGNKIHTIEGRYKEENELPKLADVYHGEILFSREVIYHDDYILLKGYLTKNYILKDYFTGVMSKRRSWAIAKNNEALTRYDLTKLYVEFSYQEKVDDLAINLYQFENVELMQMLLSNFDSNGYQTITNAVVSTERRNIKYPQDGYGYEIDFNIESQGMSLCLNFGFNDNYSVGNYAFKDGGNYRNGIYKYTDPYGEIDFMKVEFCNYVDAGDGYIEYPSNLQKYDNYNVADTTSKQLSVAARNKPLLKNPTTEKYRKIVLRIPNYFKDSREILKHTLQFEYCSDSDEIIVNPEFVKGLYLSNQEVGNYKIFVNTDPLNFKRYHIGDTKPIGIEDTEGKYGFAVDYFPNKKQFSASITLETYFDRPRGWNIYTWGIVDENGKLMFGVNVRDKGTPIKPDPILKIFANLLKYRDDNVYDLDDNVLGKMWDFPKP